MICPQCKAEYRRGFTVCRDCDVALVESPRVPEENLVDSEPPATPGDPRKDPFCSFWKGTDLRVCTEICTVLDEARIPYKTIRRQDHLFNLNNQSPYEVGVPASLYEKAELAIKEAFGTDAEGAEDAVYESEEAKLLPEQTNHITDAGILSPLMNIAKSQGHELLREMKRPEEDAEANRESDAEVESASGPDLHAAKASGSWYPEDATAAVWEGEPAEAREMVELSMQENDIRTRLEIQDGKPRLYVLQEDEERAKEIVKEILEGQPPE
jgi:hypothetical protein